MGSNQKPIFHFIAFQLTRHRILLGFNNCAHQTMMTHQLKCLLAKQIWLILIGYEGFENDAQTYNAYNSISSQLLIVGDCVKTCILWGVDKREKSLLTENLLLQCLQIIWQK